MDMLRRLISCRIIIIIIIITQLTTHQKLFVGRAPPGPTGELMMVPRFPSWIYGRDPRTGKDGEARREKGWKTNIKGRKEKREGKGQSSTPAFL